MLQELVIHDFAIIEDLSIEFNDGMTVLTGETGAGKSIIIDAVGLLAGGRGSVDFIRTGATKCDLEGLFVVDNIQMIKAKLDALGIPQEDDSILLQRSINQKGRNICRINGHLVNITTLKQIGEMLVDIHGQNEHQELMYPEKHLGLLDHFSQKTIIPVLQSYQRAYENYRKLKKTWEDRQANEQQWAQRLDMLQFQTSEIEAAQIKPGEEADLTSERDRLENFQKINENLQLSYETLNGGEQNAMDQIGQAMTAMQEIAHLDPEYQSISKSINDAFYELQDVSSSLSHQLDDLSWDEGRLNEIEKRLDVLNELKRKYGQTLTDVAQYYQKIKKELDAMQATDEDNDALETDLTTAQQKMKTHALRLTNLRKTAAKQLVKAIQQELADLYMDKAKFSVRFKTDTDPANYSLNGADSVEFYMQTNPGERSKPLAKIASGGEMSRIMLALKTIFSRNEGVTSIIFDEVDTGVSGRVAQSIANKIAMIARHSQVLCITHLPQVAAMADYQLHIEKQISHGRTTTHVSSLKPKARTEEIARMITGTELTELSLKHAQELLNLATEARKQLIKAS